VTIRAVPDFVSAPIPLVSAMLIPPQSRVVIFGMARTNLPTLIQTKERIASD
jgi:hypothetical protein